MVLLAKVLLLGAHLDGALPAGAVLKAGEEIENFSFAGTVVAQMNEVVVLQKECRCKYCISWMIVHFC
jgi:hypothetical protein